MKKMKEYAPNTITFSFGEPPEEIIRLNKEGFFWKGKLIENDHEIYEKFKEWINNAHNLSKASTVKPNSIEGYQNTIELLRRALEFYANKDNYVVNHPINTELFSFVEMDGGTQARFTLDKVRELDALNEKMEKEYNAELDALQNIDNEELAKTLSSNDDQFATLRSAIEDLKKMNNLMDDIKENTKYED